MLVSIEVESDATKIRTEAQTLVAYNLVRGRKRFTALGTNFFFHKILLNYRTRRL